MGLCDLLPAGSRNFARDSFDAIFGKRVNSSFLGGVG